MNQLEGFQQKFNQSSLKYFFSSQGKIDPNPMLFFDYVLILNHCINSKLNTSKWCTLLHDCSNKFGGNWKLKFYFLIVVNFSSITCDFISSVVEYGVLISCVWSILLLKSDLKWFIHLSRSLFNIPTTWCHCWWISRSPGAQVAKFYGRLRLIRSVLRPSKFSVLNLI